MLTFLKRNIFIIIIFLFTLILGFLTFLTFIDKSFIELNNNNLKKQQFVIKNSVDTIKSKFKEEKTAVRYITLNKKRIIKQIIDLTKKKYEINIYGYSNKVSKTYVGNHKKVWMTAFLIDKTKPYKIKKDISL